MVSVEVSEQDADVLTVIVLLLVHYHLGSLTLADVLSTLDTSPELLKNPVLSRLFACKTIVNTLTLALDNDRYSGEDNSPFGSILLRDPSLVVMVETLSRTGQAILLLLEAGEVTQSTAQTMMAVIVTALAILCQISVTALYVLTSLRRLSAKHKLNLRSIPEYSPLSARSEHVSLLRMCDRDFIDEFLQEMQIQSSADHSLLDRTIAKHEKPATNPPESSDEPPSIDSILNSFTSNLWNNR